MIKINYITFEQQFKLGPRKISVFNCREFFTAVNFTTSSNFGFKELNFKYYLIYKINLRTSYLLNYDYQGLAIIYP